MFLDELTVAQKTTFFALAKRMIMADGQIVASERRLLDQLLEEMGKGIVAPAEEIFTNTNLRVFDSHRVRMIVALELLSLAHADADFHMDEALVYHDIGAVLGLSETQFHMARGWARKRIAGAREDELRAEAATLLES